MRLKFIVLASLLSLISLSEGKTQESKREFRAVWISTVSNLDWPKYATRNQPELQKAELIRMLELYKSMNLNAVLLQVRPECDALYNSAYEPWSRYLSTDQGDDPGYDPLQFAIDEAHKRGIELHAWLNPYRINASTSDGGDYYHSTHVYKEHPEWAIEYDNGKKILNPGLPEVMSYIGKVVRDLGSNYDIDGIHFDDYFYSYNGTPDSLDQDEFDLYAGAMSRDDWRRNNVNRMIDTVYTAIQEVNSNIRFGVSPFGIYKNGVPSGIVGMDAYSVIYCDPIAWLTNQNVDYLTPQLYWPTGGGQDFETLVNWWSDQVFANNRHVYPGHGIYRLDDNPVTKDAKDLHELKSYFNFSEEFIGKSTSDPVADWTLSQLGLQVDLVRVNQAKNGLGSVYFRANDFDRVTGLIDYIKNNKYTQKSLIPEMTWKSADSPVKPENIRIENDSLRWDYAGNEDDRFAIYMTNEAIISSEIIANSSNLVDISYDNTFLESTLDQSKKYLVISAISPIGEEGEPSIIFNVEINSAALEFAGLWRVDDVNGNWKHYYRGLSYGNNHVYYAGTFGSSVFNQEDQFVRVFDAMTGDELDTLDNTGITPYGYGLRAVQTSDDGSILAGNMTLDASAAHPFTIWRWTDENDQPDSLTAFTTSGRIDMFTSIGDISDDASLMSAVNGLAKVSRIIIADGVIGAETEITLQDLPSTGSISNVCPIGTSALDQFWYNNTAVNPMLYNADGTLVGAIPDELFTNGTTGTMKLIDYKSNNYLMVADSGAAKLIDITGKAPQDLTTDDIIYFNTSNTQNSIYQDVDFGFAEGGALMMFAFSDYNSGDNAYINAYLAEVAPIANDVVFTGSSMVDSLLNLDYTYFDDNGDLEGDSEIKWYLSDDDQGTNKTVITNNAALLFYTPTYDNLGKFISATVVPYAQSGKISNDNNLVETTLTEITTAAYKPEARNLAISGDLEVNSTLSNILTASYDFYDEDGDPEGESIYKWWKADDIAGTNLVEIALDTLKYALQLSDSNKYISFSIVPIAISDHMSQGEFTIVTSNTAVIVPEQAPVASNVTISGSPEVGETVTGTYNYSDADDDTEGTSLYKWFYSANPNGIDSVEITSETTTNYTITSDLEGKYIAFEVTPVSSSGQTDLLEGNATISTFVEVLPANLPPEALNVEITGIAEVGQILTGSYTYFDENSDPEEGTTLTWYRADALDETKTSIASDTIKYELLVGDEGKYIFFGVIPVSDNGLFGQEILDTTGLIAPEPSAPIAGNVIISGIPEVGKTLTGSYEYSDTDGDEEGQSLFQWFYSDNTDGSDSIKIVDETSISYIITSDLEGKYIAFEVTPVSATGGSEYLIGETAISEFIEILPENLPPEAQNVEIFGIEEVGQILSGSYTYFDADGDIENGTIQTWYRADIIDGTRTEIATSTNNYELVAEDLGKYIYFGIIPASDNGLSGEEAFDVTNMIAPEQTAPVANNVIILGTPEIGEALTGSYEYADADDDIEGESLFRWLYSENVNGTDAHQIGGATTISYTITSGLANKYIAFSVIPVSATGTAETLTGEQVISEYIKIFQVGIVNFENSEIKLYPNPVHDLLNIEGNKKIASITIFDLMGRKMKQVNEPSEENQVNLSTLKSGIYFVEIIDNRGNIKTVRILKN